MKVLELRATPSRLRLLAFSDCRVQDIASLLQWVRSVPPFDLILYAGDDAQRFHPDGSTNYFEQLAAAARFGLGAVYGNDDLPEEHLIRGSNVYDLHAHPVGIGKFLLIGNECAPLLKDAHNAGFSFHSEREIAAHLRASVPRRARRTIIIVSHAPPRGCLDEALQHGTYRIGSPALRRFVEKDRRVALVVCGHVHLSGGRQVQLNRATVLNIASIGEAPRAPLRIAEIELTTDGKCSSNIRDLKSPFDVGRISDIGPHRARLLAAAGIDSIQRLASATSEQVANALGWRSSKAQIFVARAKARLSGQPISVRAPRLPTSPRRYLDIETDLRHSYCWLIGIGSDRDDHVEQFLAPSPDDERAILESFLKYMDNGDRTPILHFSGTSFDRRILIARLASPGLPIPSPLEESVDCFPELFRAIAAPTEAFGLKDIGAVFGYRFAFPGMDGFQVAHEYERTIRAGGQVPDHLRLYNKDDVLSLRHVIQRVQELASAAPLELPV